MIKLTRTDEISSAEFLASLLTVAMLAVPAANGSAQTPAVAPGPQPPAAVVVSPPPPLAPSVITRDDRKRATIRAVRVSQPPTIDGRLDEEIYRTVPGAGDFVQQVPLEGQPATEQTELWVLFDDKNIYLVGRCFDSQPEREVANEMRRDNNNMTQNESVSITLDTFLDRRNGFFFQTTPLGGLRDQAIVDDSVNEAWNTVWDVKTARTEQGWTFEMSIPFKSLRYAQAGEQVWGINVRRIVLWKNETSYLSAVPASYGVGAVLRPGVGGTLVGLETPAQSINLEVKPYLVGALTTDNTAPVPYANKGSHDVGFDFKYGLTRSLIADATYNTDFAQVEEDLQQVNLTRFNQFFPEKRDFFLEGLGIFSFAGVSSGTTQGSALPSDRDVPIVFFSRQIGFSNGQTVPVILGGRVTGKTGRNSIGVLNIETGEKPDALATDTNFSVVRYKRDILRRSGIGMMFTRRVASGGAQPTNMAAGVDANFTFRNDYKISGYWAATDTPGVTADTNAYRGKFEYAGDRYGLITERAKVGDNFNPAVGFVRRDDFTRTFGELRFSPRTAHSRLIRRYTYQLDQDYVTNSPRTVVQNKESKGTFKIEFHSSDVFMVDVKHDYEFLPKNFTISASPRVVVPTGAYTYDTFDVSHQIGSQHRISGTVTAAMGSLYNGTKKELTYSGRAIVQDQLAFEPTVTLDWVRLPYGDFDVRLLGTRIVYAVSPRMLVSSLIQYNYAAHTVNSSLRFTWEYIPGSQMFVVYSDGRDVGPVAANSLLNHSVAVKVTRLVRF